jgi:hypothetical protein
MECGIYGAGYTMHFVIDETIRCVHLAAGVAIGALKRVLAFEGSAAPSVSNIAMDTSGKLRSFQTCKKSELSWINFALVVCCHVYGCVLWLGYVVVGHWQTTGFGSNLDVSIECFSSDRRGSEAGINS